MFTKADILQAQKTIYNYMQASPQMSWPVLNNILGLEAIVKHENINPTGAFKVRGGLIFMDSLKKKGQSQGVISATRGNHGQSLAFAGGLFDIKATIIVPKKNSQEKNTAIKALGATLIEHGEDFEEARLFAAQYAKEHNLIAVPSFAPELALGVATYHYELLSQHPDIEHYYVPVGMGSGICSAIMVRDLLGLKTKIYGVVAKGAPTVYNSFKAGKIINSSKAETLADGIATRMLLDDVFEVVYKGAEDIIRLEDDEISTAIHVAWQSTHQLLEGAGAASLAAALQRKEKTKGQKIGISFSGANIDKKLFCQWVLKNQVT